MSEEYVSKELLASEVKCIDDIDRRQNRGITLLTLAVTLGALIIGAIQLWLATRG